MWGQFRGLGVSFFVGSLCESSLRPGGSVGFSCVMSSSVSLGIDGCASVRCCVFVVVVLGCVSCCCGSSVGCCGGSVCKFMCIP